MHCISCAWKRKVEKPLLFKQTLKSRFTCLACQQFSFDAKKSLDRERPFSLALLVVSLFSCLSRLAPSVTRVAICVSRVLLDGLQKKERLLVVYQQRIIQTVLNENPQERFRTQFWLKKIVLNDLNILTVLWKDKAGTLKFVQFSKLANFNKKKQN